MDQRLTILEDITSKIIMSLPNFDRKSIFIGVQIPDEQSDKSNTFKKETNVSKRSFKNLVKTWAKKIIKPTSNSKIYNRNKENNKLIA